MEIEEGERCKGGGGLQLEIQENILKSTFLLNKLCSSGWPNPLWGRLCQLTDRRVPWSHVWYNLI